MFWSSKHNIIISLLGYVYHCLSNIGSLYVASKIGTRFGDKQIRHELAKIDELRYFALLQLLTFHSTMDTMFEHLTAWFDNYFDDIVYPMQQIILLPINTGKINCNNSMLPCLKILHATQNAMTKMESIIQIMASIKYQEDIDYYHSTEQKIADNFSEFMTMPHDQCSALLEHFKTEFVLLSNFRKRKNARVKSMN